MWKLLMGAVAAALVLGVAGAGAGHEESGVKSYTGCLSGGVIFNLKEGESPAFSCVLSPQIHLAGGDITAVRAGTGLTGGSENGVATIGLGASFGLPQGCANGAVPKWNGTAWGCGADNDTTYSAGADLDLVGTTFSVEPGSFARANRSCAAGQFARGVDGNGNPTCAAPGGGRAFHTGGTAKEIDGAAEVAALNLPAGSYLIIGKATVSNGDRDDQDASCRLSTGDATLVRLGPFEDAESDKQAIPVLDTATFNGPTRVAMTCGTFNGLATLIDLTAISVGGIN